jgi:2-(1,2-epoxy-1,2-dihydrophenyl)acetyl-CoA isomerase
MTLVKLDREDAIGVLTLCRSTMHNALVPELLQEVVAALAEVGEDQRLRALVLAAEGPAFSIGGDMRRFLTEHQAGKLTDYASRVVGSLNETVLAMTRLSQPIVAAVHGTVTGGSLGFVVGADLVVLADDAVLKSHYASAGFCPDGGWTALLPGLIGQRRATEALLLNRSINAGTALDWGLVNALAPASQVLVKAKEMARKIASYPQGTMQYSKRLLAMQHEQLAARLEAERQGFLQLIAGTEAQNGLAAFLQQFTSYPGGGGDMAATPRPL